MSVIVRFKNSAGFQSFSEGRSWAWDKSVLTIYDRRGKKLGYFDEPESIASVSTGADSSVIATDTKPLFINFILDETGSMFSVLDATINGFNEYIQGLKGRPAKEVEGLRFTLTQFNSNKVQVVQNSVRLSNVTKLTRQNYRPNYATPLYDAIGQTIQAMERESGGSNVLCVIQTDGEENSSREWDRQKIFNLISKKQREGWTFAFLGANQDAWEAGGAMGIPMGNTISYRHTPYGTINVMRNLVGATASYTATGGAPTADLFSGKIDIRDEDETTKKKG